MRTFASADLVQLPRLDVAGAVSLGNSLLTVRKSAGPLVALVEKAANRLETRITTLVSAQASRLGTGPAADPERRAAGLEFDAVWSATSSWVTGWANLPTASSHATDAKRAAAIRIQSICFAEGLAFTKIEMQREWAESNARLERIAKDDLGKDFELLGGADFLSALQSVHTRYGIALGVTKEAPAETAAVALREPLLEVIDGLRKYVIAVSGSVDEDDAATARLAERLLRPLTEWTVGEGREGKAAPTPGPDEPVVPTP